MDHLRSLLVLILGAVQAIRIVGSLIGIVEFVFVDAVELLILILKLVKFHEVTRVELSEAQL